MFCKTESNVDNNDGTNDIDAVVFLITGGPVKKTKQKNSCCLATSPHLTAPPADIMSRVFHRYLRAC